MQYEIHRISYNLYTNDYWKLVDKNIDNWCFSGDLIQVNDEKEIIIIPDGRVKDKIIRVENGYLKCDENCCCEPIKWVNKK